MTAARDELTRILREIDGSDATAWDRLVPLVYEELRGLAHRRLQALRPGRTIHSTVLVHETYLKMVGESPGADWRSRGHFFGAAARAMRNLLVDEVRRRSRAKHGGGRARVPLDTGVALTDDAPPDLLDLDTALDELAQLDPRAHEVVLLRYFAGLTIDESAECLDVSTATVERKWSFARAWLQVRLRALGPATDPGEESEGPST